MFVRRDSQGQIIYKSTSSHTLVRNPINVMFVRRGLYGQIIYKDTSSLTPVRDPTNLMFARRGLYSQTHTQYPFNVVFVKRDSHG